MDYRRAYDSYKDAYEGDDDYRNHRSSEDYRTQGYDERNLRERGRNFSHGNQGYSGERRFQNRGLDYPDRYSAGSAYAQENYSDQESYFRQGATRSHLRCREIMTRNLTTCHKNTPVQEIARLMRTEDIGSIPVLDENGKLEGIVTDRDIIVSGLTGDKNDAEITAEDCMSRDLYTANQNDRIVDVIREMGDHQVRRIPVVDRRDRLVGIISMADVATQTNRDKELGESLEEISKPSSWFGRMAYYLGF
ncbi:MAG: CBS domain-containing protein [Acidobacteriota bacterium]